MRLFLLTLLLIAVPLLWDANSEPLEVIPQADTLLTIHIRPKTDTAGLVMPFDSGALLPGESVQLKKVHNPKGAL